MEYRIFNRRKRQLTRAVDAMGYALTAPARLLRRTQPLEAFLTETPVRRILVIRTAYVGDVVMTLPLLRPLAERFPDAHIDFCTAPGAIPLLEGNPSIHETIPCMTPWFHGASWRELRASLAEIRKRPRYDLVIEARGDVRELLLVARPLGGRRLVSYAVGGGGFLLTDVVPHPTVNHRVPYHLDIARYLGADTDEERPTWRIALREEEVAETRALLHAKGLAEGFLCCHPGSRMSLKQWPAERFAAACDLLFARHGLPVAVLGSPAETSLADRVISGMRAPAVSLAGRLSLRQLAGVIDHSDLLICNDSAPMHLGACMGTPVAALFGPSKPEQTGPWPLTASRHRIVTQFYPCRAHCDEAVCTHPEHHACMRALTPEMAAELASQALAQGGG